MGSTLTIEPLYRSKKNLSFEIKKCLQKKFNGTVLDQTMEESDLNFLYGLLYAGIEDAQIIIDMIKKYGSVTLNEEF